MSLSKTTKENCFHITLDNPSKHNAFDPELISDLKAAFIEASNSDCRSVLLSGKGPSFSAGADLNWMKSMASAGEQENIKDSEVMFEMFEAAAQCKKPVIGKAQGNVMGGGLGLIAVCDLAAAESDTKFCFSEVKLGLAPAVISPFILRKANLARARDLMLTGRMFTAQEAYEMGLVQFVGNSSEVDEYISKQQQRFLKLGPEAVSATKELIDDVVFGSWKDMKSKTAKVIAERRVSEEGQEGLSSFFEKRTPSWSKQ